MSIFGDKDKEKAALRTQLSEARNANEVLKTQLEQSGQKIDSLKMQVAAGEAEVRQMQDRLKGLRPQSSIVLMLIRYATRLLGLALVAASAVICKWLAEGNGGEKISLDWGLELLWGLYLFCQCAGLFLVAFAPSRSHTHLLVFGVYMTTLLVLLAGVLAYSFRGGPIPYNVNLVNLIAVNSVGILLLAMAERKLRFERTG